MTMLIRVALVLAASCVVAFLLRTVVLSVRRLEGRIREFKQEAEDGANAKDPWTALAELYAEDRAGRKPAGKKGRDGRSG